MSELQTKINTAIERSKVFINSFAVCRQLLSQLRTGNRLEYGKEILKSTKILPLAFKR